MSYGKWETREDEEREDDSRLDDKWGDKERKYGRRTTRRR